MPPQKTADFVHLHNHSQYSLLDGASQIDELAARAAEFGMPALALTDHGNLFGAVKFYKACRKAGVKPIIGCETYVAPGDRRERKIHSDIRESSFHLTLLCRNREGWDNLMKLVSYAYLEGFYYRPRIDKELLGRFGRGLIGMSACLKGEVNYWLSKGDAGRAMNAAASYQELLGPENFYLEVMRNGFPEQERIIPGVLELSAELGIPVVATNDCHYLRREDARAHEALLCIQTGKKLTDDARMKMSSDQLYFRSPEEMRELFRDLPDAVRRTREVAERCELDLDFDKVTFHLPRFDVPEGFSGSGDYLEHLARKGLAERYPEVTPRHEGRLKQELDVIREMGFPGYFLVVKDIVDFARGKAIPVGPGRGSAAGSLVLYCLGITDIDPLRYDLLFERFLNTERVTLPDVDIDFSDTRRPEIIEYIRERYGRDSVAQIISFGTMKSRAVVRDVGRVMDVPIGEVDRLAKLIPQGMELDKALVASSELRQLVEGNPQYRELVAIARRLEGLNRHASIHASAVVITPKPLIEVAPIYRTPEDDVCTQFDMYSLDDVGLLKLDVLGLTTLTVVEEATRLIREAGHEFDPGHLPLDDGPTYELLQRGDGVGVFQLESAGMRDLCRRMQPESLEHIIALIALYRPGPMDLIPTYVARKEGKEKIEYEHPLLEPICRETYGILIYQEQVMQAAQTLAGYTLGSADLLRRAMGKKKPEQMAAQRDVFVKGCADTNRIGARQAQRIFDLLAKFAGYGFNKSHAAGYGLLSYITAFLKANYPVEFICATLISEQGNFKKLAKFVSEARHMGIEVLRPDVNLSRAEFAIEPAGDRRAVRFALAGIKNIGHKAAELLVREREENGRYEGLLDLLMRNRGTLNRKAAESLIKAGALDGFDPNRTRLLAGLELEMARAGSERLRFEERQASLFGEDEPEMVSEDVHYDTRQLLSYEKQAFGFYFSSHPLEPWLVEYDGLNLVRTGELAVRNDGDAVAIGGVITSRRWRKDRRDRQYAILTLEDFDDTIEVAVFADPLEKYREYLFVDNLVIFQGRVRRRDELGVPQLWCDRALPFTSAWRHIQRVMLVLDGEDSTNGRLEKFRALAAQHDGEAMVFFRVRDKDGRKRVVWAKEFKLKPTNECLLALRELFGKKAVAVQGELPRVEDSRRRYRRQS
ncbi:DNA polymerase III subunit alpha [candidate division WOR-3 bacterium]|nr:DNA polymerase III subunit alpha [candidate division WOR-3 bacterium]